MKNNASLIYGFLLVIGDFLALVAAFVTAYILRVSIDDRPITAAVTSREYLRVFLFLLPFWLIIFGLLGLYNKNTYEKRFSEFGRIIVGSVVGILFIIGYSFMTGRTIFPARLVAIYGLGLALFFLVLFRTIARGIRREMFHFGFGINKVLIIGDTPITSELLELLSEVKVTGYKVVGIVGGKKHRLVDFQASRVFDTFDEAIHQLRNEQIHSIIQTELYASQEANNDILTYAQQHHIAYRFVPGNSELFVGKIEVDLFRSIPVIAVHQTALVGWGRIVKRLFDVFMGLALLILAAIPMLIIAILVKLTDPKGKILYKPSRLGRFGHTFKCYKFRSMYKKYSDMSPEEGFAKMGRPELAIEYRKNGDQIPRDPRVTPIGRFIRIFSLDELPQLFNVVKGDISLVGPRALDPFELEKHAKKNLILSVKTGLTGLAQISGRSDLPFEERRKLDIYYVQNWSFWGDIVILLRTISVVIFHRGAR
jgi:exopolysaccharide biosynthesis polyprenyl glycosylphosphotransferase